MIHYSEKYIIVRDTISTIPASPTPEMKLDSKFSSLIHLLALRPAAEQKSSINNEDNGEDNEMGNEKDKGEGYIWAK